MSYWQILKPQAGQNLIVNPSFEDGTTTGWTNVDCTSAVSSSWQYRGVKTALVRARDAVVAEKGGLTRTDRADLCAGFQAAVTDVLAEKSRRALRDYGAGATAFAVAGGVAANRTIRAALEQVAAAAGLRFLAPPLKLCTDNAAMIAWAGIERLRLGRRDGMDLAARPRWPLDAASPALIGGGKKGAKA